MNYVSILGVGLLLFLVFKVSRVFLIETKRFREAWGYKLFMVVELVAWITFFFATVDIIFAGKTYRDFLFVGLVVVFVGLLSWFLVRELIAGALFKIQYIPQSGKYLKAGDIEGTIDKVKRTHVTIETLDNKSLKVPYTRLQNKVIVLGDKKELDGGDFQVRLKVRADISREVVERDVKRQVLQSPFTSFKKAIRIRQVEEQEKFSVYEVSFAVISPTYFYRIKEQLENLFSGR